MIDAPVEFSPGDPFAITLETFGNCISLAVPVGHSHAGGDSHFDSRPNSPGWICNVEFAVSPLGPAVPDAGGPCDTRRHRQRAGRCHERGESAQPAPMTGLECGDGSASLRGSTCAGQAIVGTDSIRKVDCARGLSPRDSARLATRARDDLRDRRFDPLLCAPVDLAGIETRRVDRLADHDVDGARPLEQAAARPEIT